MKFFKDDYIQKGVITGVISTLIVIIFIDPILTFGWNILNTIAEHTFLFFQDSLYKNAAIGKRNWIDVIIVSILMVPFFVYTSINLKKDMLKILKINESNQDDKSKKPEVIKSNKGNYLKILLNILSLPILFLMLISIFSDLQLNASFEQRINAIAPYIDGPEEEILISRWACMKKRTDYEEINKIIDSHARNAGIEVPKPLLK